MLFFATVALAAAGISFAAWADGAAAEKMAEEIQVPDLSEDAQSGEIVFEQNCAGCHGTNASGTDSGPRLIHQTYGPSHHGDEAIVRAVKEGAPQHHWPFGDMPALPHVSPEQIDQVIHYIRELQRANGIM